LPPFLQGRTFATLSKVVKEIKHIISLKPHIQALTLQVSGIQTIYTYILILLQLGAGHFNWPGTLHQLGAGHRNGVNYRP